MVALNIKKEFRELIPPLSEEEFLGLEKNILTYGCKHPIETWNNFIIDGHHRYEICQKHIINFKAEEVDLPDEEAVILWMIDNQSDRRNMTTAAKIRLKARKITILQKRAEERMKSGGYECKGSIKHPSIDLC